MYLLQGMREKPPQKFSPHIAPICGLPKVRNCLSLQMKRLLRGKCRTRRSCFHRQRKDPSGNALARRSKYSRREVRANKASLLAALEWRTFMEGFGITMYWRPIPLSCMKRVGFIGSFPSKDRFHFPIPCTPNTILTANPTAKIQIRTLPSLHTACHSAGLRVTINPMNLHPTSGRFTYCYWYPPAARRSCALL